MLSWLAKRLISHNMARSRAGEVYEDTEKAKALDDWPAVHQPALAGP
jgi:hypothetical protein